MKKLLFPLIFALLFSFSLTALADSSYSWYFKPTTDHSQPKVIPEATNLLKNHSVVYLGNDTDKKVYLTFDAGYDNGYHTGILDTLKEKEVSAVFFVDGNFLKRNPDTAKRIVAEGHLLCNHTLHHPDLAKLTKEEVQNELLGWEKLYTEIIEKEPTKLFRPPMGRFNETTLKAAEEIGYKAVFWSFAYADWDTERQPTHEYALSNLEKRIHSGAVILLHSTSKTNSETLPKMIDNLKENGYTFERIDSL